MYIVNRDKYNELLYLYKVNVLDSVKRKNCVDFKI